MSTSIYLAIPIMLLLAVAQTAILPRFPIWGVTPQLPLLVALAWGLLHHSDEGIMWAFVAGLLLDLFSIVPLGVTAFAFVVAVFVSTSFTQAFPSSRFILPLLVGILATLIYLLLYFLLLRFVGHPIEWQTAASWLSLAVLHGILILPIYWLMYWLERTFRPRRVEI